jgi:peptidoglycan L-alanyl-D-glutamate endopeptidase CwlK
MTWRFSHRSEARMVGVHPDLVRIARRALELSPVDFGITEGMRTLERQKQLVAAGASKTMKSRHLTGHALDVVAYVGSDVRWDWPLYTTISKAFKQAAIDLKLHVEWGGDWRSFRDGPHYQLAWREYPA